MSAKRIANVYGIGETGMNAEVEKYEMAYSFTRLEETANTFRRLGETYEDVGSIGTAMGTIKRQLFMVADVLDQCRGYSSQVITLSKSEESDIIRVFLSKGIRIKWIRVVQRAPQKKEIVIMARTVKRGCVTTKDMAAEISRYFEGNFYSSKENRIIINEEFYQYSFFQEARFCMLYGISRYNKDKMKVSGDNFFISALECGRTVAALADGMGTGKKAFCESQAVIELMEQCLNAGFDEKTSIEMINAAFIAGEYGGNPVTVDMSIVDRNLGVLNCIKMGAASTFVKRDNWVEIIKSTTLPIGVLEQVDYDCTAKKLYDGDYVVMVSDGILENLPFINKEQKLVEIINSIVVKAPEAMASEILDKSLAYNSMIAKDDMTVIVLGLFDTHEK